MHDLHLLQFLQACAGEQLARFGRRQKAQICNAHSALLTQRLRERHARLLQANFERNEGVSQGVEFRIESGCAAAAGRGEGRRNGGEERSRREERQDVKKADSTATKKKTGQEQGS